MENDKKEIPLVHIITWHYSDGSAYGIVRAFHSEEIARHELKLLQEHSESMRTFKIDSVELISAIL